MPAVPKPEKRTKKPPKTLRPVYVPQAPKNVTATIPLHAGAILRDRPVSACPYSKQSQLGRQMLSVEDYKIDTKSEKELQDKCEDWLRERGIYFIHIPNAAYKNPKSGHILLGIPDILVFIPNQKNHFNQSVLFELKGEYGKARDGQKRVARQANVYLLKSYIGFIDIMQEFLRTIAKGE